MTEAAPVSGVSPQETRSNPFSRMIGALMTPGRTFAEIARRPDWVVPALTILILSVLVMLVLVPRIDFESATREAMAARQTQMQQQDMDKAIRIGSAFAKAWMYFSPLIGMGWIALLALIYFGAVRLIGGEGTYLQSFSILLYSWVPRLLKALIMIPIALSKHGIRVQEMETLVRSNGAFLVDLKTQPMLYALLASLDLFTIWSLVLLVIGIAAMSKMSKAKSAAVVVVVSAVFLLLRVGLAALSSLKAAHR